MNLYGTELLWNRTRVNGAYARVRVALELLSLLCTLENSTKCSKVSFDKYCRNVTRSIAVYDTK